ncbi:hypothetical protein I553_3673 [Mycobacterium xenopi 4042]|uniref:Uncharacterized protein n=1 Tax=Mycobacterium xenopi 4042 TaxID=1299334 RepID=X7ZGL5_MYCXE|nr:hypothetical protein I553_3673 [Mycobacterium xenopi 4042]
MDALLDAGIATVVYAVADRTPSPRRAARWPRRRACGPGVQADWWRRAAA